MPSLDRQWWCRRGDIGGIRSTGFFGRAIRWRKRKEGATEQTSHVWRVIEDGWFPAPAGERGAQIVEALVRHGVVERDMTEAYSAGVDDLWIARPVNLTAEELGEIVGWTRAQVGRRYSLGMIWRHLFGSEEGIGEDARAVICSYVVAAAERRIAKDWGLPTRMADTQEVERFIASHLGKTHCWIKPPGWRGNPLQ